MQVSRNLILTLSAALALGAVAILYWGYKSPLAVSSSSPVQSIIQKTASSDHSEPTPEAKAEQELSELLELCQIELQRPLVDPPLSQTVPVAHSNLPITLVGSINEPGHSMAILRKPDSTHQICSVGDTLDLNSAKAVILNITPQKTTLRIGAEIHELPLQIPEVPHVE